MKRMIPLLVALSAAAQQRPPVPPQNAEYEALQAHFERHVKARHDHLFDGIRTVAQWESRQKLSRARLEKMLWGDFQWPAAAPKVEVTHREDHAGYRLENLILEVAPSLFVTANLYLPARPITQGMARGLQRMESLRWLWTTSRWARWSLRTTASILTRGFIGTAVDSRPLVSNC
jgi:hypothetical protein